MLGLTAEGDSTAAKRLTPASDINPNAGYEDARQNRFWCMSSATGLKPLGLLP